MTDPRPEMVNGEPMCRPSCPLHGLNGGGCWEGVRYCPSVLRAQRDQLVAVLDKADLRALEGLRNRVASLQDFLNGRK